MSIFKWTSYNAADTAIAGASMNALANGSYAMGAAIDNTVGLYLYGDLVLKLSSSVTAGAVMPTIPVWVLPAIDGTNYPTPPGATAGGAPGNLQGGTASLVGSTATSVIIVRGMVLPPSLFKILIQNNLGIAFPASSASTCQLFRYNEQAS